MDIINAHNYYGLLRQVKMESLHNGDKIYFIYVESMNSSVRYKFMCNSYTYHELVEARFTDTKRKGIYITFAVNHGTGMISHLVIEKDE